MVEKTVKGAALGFHGPLHVRVGLEDGKIKSLACEHSSKALVGDLGIAQMKAAMLEKGSADVDAVSGATFSSLAFKNAVQKALAADAGKISQEEALNPETDNPYAIQPDVDAVTSPSLAVLQDVKNTSPVQPVIPLEQVSKYDASYDLVIVGSGGAGLSAAVEAARGGLSVLICEKAGIAGGTTNYSGGVVQAAGTPYQKALTAYQEDTPEKHAELWIKAGENVLDADLVRDLAQSAPQNIEWLSQMGIKWTSVYGHSHIPYVKDDIFADRIHVYENGGQGGDGVVLTQALFKEALKAGAKIEYNTTVVSLIQDQKTKAIHGVAALVGGEKKLIAAKKGVLLATASIDHNPALAKAYNPQQFNDLAFNTVLTAKTNTGDGILMGLSAGAAVTGMGGCIDFCGKTGNATNNQIPTIPLIFVNGAGKRFVCEDATYAYQYRAIFQQEKQFMAPTYMIFDDNSIKEPGSAWTADSLAEDVAAGHVLKADSIEELADAILVPKDSLAETIQEWNEAMETGSDQTFGRRTGLKALQAPFYAYKNSASNLGSIGGLKINVDCQVLDLFDKVIPHLYAAGLNAGGWIAGYYPGSGTAISGIVHQGRKAAQHLLKS
ncbi:FAD-dependent oxidoreductase [Streptococcus orisasini]